METIADELNKTVKILADMELSRDELTKAIFKLEDDLRKSCFMFAVHDFTGKRYYHMGEQIVSFEVFNDGFSNETFDNLPFEVKTDFMYVRMNK